MKFAHPIDKQNLLATAKTMFQSYLNMPLSSSLWRKKDISLLANPRATKSRSIPTSQIRYSSRESFVGASAKGNCKDFDNYARLSNDNAPVCGRGVKDISRRTRKYNWLCDKLIVALREIKIKLFAVCYV